MDGPYHNQDQSPHVPDDGHGPLGPPRVGVDEVGPLSVVVHRHGELVAARARVHGQVPAVDAVP